MRFAITFLILVMASPALAGEPAYTWRTRPDDPSRAYLYLDGKQVGGWCYDDKHYRPFDGKEWGSPSKTAPIKPPAKIQITIGDPASPATPTKPSVMRPLPSYGSNVPGVRGPLRRKAANIFADIMIEGTMRVIEEIPNAILDSIKKGNFKVEVK